MVGPGLLIGVYVVAAGFWGPDPDSMGIPFVIGVVIRVLYLFVVPLVAWFLLYYAWQKWQPDKATEDRLARGVAAAIAGALFVAIVLILQAEFHEECTDAVRTGDGPGKECVGDYVTVPGPDLFMAFMAALGGIGFLWWSLRRPEDNGPDEDRDR
jgi:hypothetical protein